MEHGNRMKLNNIRHSCISSGYDTCMACGVVCHCECHHATIAPYAHTDHKFCSISPWLIRPHCDYVCFIFIFIQSNLFFFDAIKTSPMPIAPIRIRSNATQNVHTAHIHISVVTCSENLSQASSFARCTLSLLVVCAIREAAIKYVDSRKDDDHDWIDECLRLCGTMQIKYAKPSVNQQTDQVMK